MPYKTIQELPLSVKILPRAAQEIWRRVFNRVIQTKPEIIAIKTAWSVVKQFYQKNKNSKWVRKK